MFCKVFTQYLAYFSSPEFKKLESIQSDTPVLSNLFEASYHLCALFEIFLKKKTKDKFRLYILDFNEIYSELTFTRLSLLILNYPTKQLTVGMGTSLELPDMCFKFIYEFFIKKQFFYLDRIKVREVPYLSPIYR